MKRRTVLRGAISGIALSSMAGCTDTGTDMSGNEEPQINPNESYGFAREGSVHSYQANGQLEVPFGDSIRWGGIELWAKGIEWGSSEVGNVASIPFAWINRTNSTLHSYNSDAFALYEAETNNNMETHPVENPYTGSNRVQPGQADTGRLGFEIPEEYTSLNPFRLALYMPARNLKANTTLDVAWGIPTGEQTNNESSTKNATNSS